MWQLYAFPFDLSQSVGSLVRERVAILTRRSHSETSQFVVFALLPHVAESPSDYSLLRCLQVVGMSEHLAPRHSDHSLRLFLAILSRRVFRVVF